MIVRERVGADYQPVTDIALQDERYAIRLERRAAEAALAADLRRRGQIEPILVETSEEGGLRIIDGFRRFRAISRMRQNGFEWNEVLMEHRHDGDTAHQLMRRLWRRNAAAPYGLIETARFVRTFADLGVPFSEIAAVIHRNRHETEDLWELATAPPPLDRILDRRRLDPALAWMFARRFMAWRREGGRRAAVSAARRVFASLDSSTLTVKSLRLHLDLFWHRGRPFMARAPLG